MPRDFSRNNLADQTSPYLLQHADNPVHWQPWEPDVLAHARSLDRPILLSVGYAACHWCHVMAHESFENPEIAAQMNALFVNIKIDREERPDLDNIYQSALALLGGQGGWPLTMFLTPKGEPFWGGTYFPNTPKYGQTAFPEVLNTIARLYRNEPDKIRANVEALTAGIGRLNEPALPAALADGHLKKIATHLLPHVDTVNGGLNGAPKFPYTSFFDLLWTVYLNEGETKFADAVTRTLAGLCQGGIYDHLAGGFARYTVDDAWLVPHFEKMLYDNAQLLSLLSRVWRSTNDPLLARRVQETVSWLEDEMLTSDGAFAASLDADSEGEEGKYYVWQSDEVRTLLGEDYDVFSKTYDITPSGNWEGKTILNRLSTPDWLGETAESTLDTCKKRLKTARNERVRPGWDDKILTDWNGLMIAGLTEAALTFDNQEWLKTAEKAFDAVVDLADAGDGQLTHAYRDGRAHISGLADDYAAMSTAALALFEATGKAAYLACAQTWCATLIRDFRDPKSGAFFLTSGAADDIIVRPFTGLDNPIPSANGLLTKTFAALHLATGNETHRQQAEQIADAFAAKAGENPLGHSTLLTNADFLSKATQVTVLGDRRAPETASLLKTIFATPIRHRWVTVVDVSQDLPPGHPASGKGTIDGKPTVYICRGQTCSLPITDPADIVPALVPPIN